VCGLRRHSPDCVPACLPYLAALELVVRRNHVVSSIGWEYTGLTDPI
jgi:hypothetical protein